MTTSISIRLAGTLEVQVDGRAIGDALGPLGRLALAYLVVERRRAVARDELADVLWGEDLPATWTAALRGVVGRIRAAFASAGLDAAALITSEAGCYRLCLPAGTVVDTEAAAAALEEAKAALEGGADDPAMELAAQAAGITAAQFLAGAAGWWVERRQAQWGELHLESLEVQSAAAARAGRVREAVEAAEEAIAAQPFRESAHRRLMAAHAAAGNRGEALRAYERCRRILADELGVDPSPATESAYLDLLGVGPATAGGGPEATASELPPPGNLPAETTSFVGRRNELAAITAHLESTRLLTLVGPGGVGKSRLALQVAAASRSAGFPDGVWLVELAGLADPDLVAHQVLGVLGVAEVVGQAPASTLAEHVSTRRLLLVLDNCEHLVESCAALAGALLRAGPGLQILATSRQPLGVDGESVWVVPPLSTPDPEEVSSDADALHYEAVRLFVDRVRAAVPGFDLGRAAARSAAVICHRLDGMPLAVELAAARARVLSVEEIARHLDDRFRLLVGGPRTAPSRHQTLRAALDWSYEALSVPESRLFRRLAVFAGGFVLEAARQVCVSDPHECDVLEALSGLVDKSLVTVDRSAGVSRYRQLETIRQYARDRLGEHGEEHTVGRRHLLWAAGLAQDAEKGLEGADQDRWLRVLDSDRDNFRAALDWAGANDAVHDGSRLATALWRFWEIRGYLSEGRSRLHRWADAEGLPAPRRAKILNSLGIMAQRQRDYAGARGFYEEALVVRRSIGDPLGIATALHGLGSMAMQHGDVETARDQFEENLALARELGEPRMAAASLMNLGVIAQVDFMRRGASLAEAGDRAHDYYQRSLEEYRRLGDRHGMALALENLGSLGPWRGEYEESRAFHEESMAIRRTLGDKLGIAASARFLGRLALRSGECSTARDLHEEYLSIERELGHKPNEAEALAFLADVARAEGENEEAVRLLEESVRIQRSLGDRRSLIWMLAGLGEAAYRAGDLNRSRAALEESAAVAREHDDGEGLVRAKVRLAVVARAVGDDRDVAALCADAVAAASLDSYPRTVADLADLAAGVTLRRGDAVLAAQLLGAAAALRATVDREPASETDAQDARDLGATRAALCDAAFEAACAHGAELGQPELMALLARAVTARP